MSPVAFDAKEQVRQAVDIVDLIGDYIPLRRAGRNFAGICPWHDDSKPSLQVNPERQSWKCWVCDIGGDIFSFVMRSEGLEFRAALEMLAERAGITLAPRHDGPSAAAGGPGDKRTLLAAAAWAEQQFHRCLLESREAEPAHRYLADRQISDASINQFHVGFAPPSWDWLLNRAATTPWSPPVFERIGLIKPRNHGSGHYDSFRGRVMFSIRDPRGRPIAFGGRILPEFADEKSAKYINSPENPLFSKSRELYGLDLAREAIAGCDPPQVVVVEGYTDCLMAHQHGVKNVVAVLGTALGERHIPVLRRFTDSITLVLDGDEAGRRRTNEILELFVAQQVDLRILTLPEGLDPCDLIASQGGDAFRKLLSEAVDALEHKLAMVTNGLDLTRDTHRAAEAVEQVLTTLASARPTVGIASSPMLLREQQMLSRIARQFRLPEDQLRVRLIALRQRTTRATAPVSSPPSPPQTLRPAQWSCWERELLELILLDASHLATLTPQIDPTTIAAPLARKWYERAVDLSSAGHLKLYERLMLEIEDAEEKQILVTLDEAAHEKAASDPVQRLADLLTAYSQRETDQRQASDQLAASENAEDADALLAKFIQQSRPKHQTEFQRRNT